MSKWYTSVIAECLKFTPLDLLHWCYRWKKNSLKRGNSAHKAVSCRCTARQPGSGCFSPLIFQVKYLHIILQLVHLLKMEMQDIPRQTQVCQSTSCPGLFYHDTACSIWEQPFSYEPATQNQLSGCFRAGRGPWKKLFVIDLMMDVFFNIKLKLMVNFCYL